MKLVQYCTCFRCWHFLFFCLWCVVFMEGFFCNLHFEAFKSFDVVPDSHCSQFYSYFLHFQPQSPETSKKMNEAQKWKKDVFKTWKMQKSQKFVKHDCQISLHEKNLLAKRAIKTSFQVCITFLHPMDSQFLAMFKSACLKYEQHSVHLFW